MKSFFSLAMLFALLTIFAGCSNNGSSDGDQSAETEAVADKASSQNQPEWLGIYEGVLPCADCEGIETTIELKIDSTFRRESVYQGKDFKATDQGTYSYNESTRVITTKDDDESETTFQYLVEDNGTLKMLDQQGEEITGPLEDNYILRKSDVK